MRTLFHRQVVAALVVEALVAGPAFAAVPHRLTEQGRLFDSAGTPLTGTVSVVFTIYDAASGGHALWSEPQSIPLDDGYFSAEIGVVTPFPAGLWDGSVRYVGVKVGADPEMAPRHATASAAYALVAGDAVGDLHPTSVSVNGQVVIDAYGNGQDGSLCWSSTLATTGQDTSNNQSCVGHDDSTSASCYGAAYTTTGCGNGGGNTSQTTNLWFWVK